MLALAYCFAARGTASCCGWARLRHSRLREEPADPFPSAPETQPPARGSEHGIAATQNTRWRGYPPEAQQRGPAGAFPCWRRDRGGAIDGPEPFRTAEYEVARLRAALRNV